ncbi:MAG: phosphatidylglycerophosphatase A [bacterium]
MREKLLEVIGTFFYIGYVPVAPGTACSFVTMVLFFFFPQFSLIQSLLLWIVLLGIGVYTAGFIAKKRGEKDPRSAVIDEVLGMVIALFMVKKTLFLYVVSFGVFRFFDIVKPFPISYIERNVDGGWGVMLDDVVAGAVTCFVMWLCFA